MRKPFVIEYTIWHFGQGLEEVLIFWQNILWFGYHFFSIPIMLKTLIRPMYRIHEESSGSGLDIPLMLQNIILNTIARLVGLWLRIIMIILGSFVELMIVLLGPFLLIIWLILPIISVFFLIIGINAIL